MGWWNPFNGGLLLPASENTTWYLKVRGGGQHPFSYTIGRQTLLLAVLSADLAVVHVNASPRDLNPGNVLSVSWSVRNAGERDLHDQQWVDAVYLSRDRFLNTSEDLLLAAVQYTEGLGVGQSYSRTLDITIPGGVAGPQYVYVRTNSERAFRERTSDNNMMMLDRSIAVDVPQLSVEVPRTGSVDPGQWTFYRLDLEAGRSVRIAIGPEDNGEGELQVFSE